MTLDFENYLKTIKENFKTSLCISGLSNYHYTMTEYFGEPFYEFDYHTNSFIEKNKESRWTMLGNYICFIDDSDLVHFRLVYEEKN